VTDWQVGQRVLALVREGGYAEYVVAHVSQLVPIPDGLAFGQATALLVQGLTAIALLRELQAGQTILIHAAAGGVGSLLVQLAKYKGAKVIGTMIIYGSASREDFQIPAWGLLANMHTVKGYYLTIDSPNNRAQYSKELMEHIKAGRLQVMVTEFPLPQAADAYRAIEGRTTMGKVVLAIN
jgi:NADPH:quinone reductase-like Zn-dependent oxidoreductase